MYNLLIVDDEPTVLRFIKYVISEYSLPFHICGEAVNGEQAVQMADQYKPHLIIMDIHMPLMDGLTAAEIIKKRQPSPIIYVLTAYEYFEYAQKAVRISVNDYLLKPLKPEQLAYTLGESIKKLQHMQAHDTEYISMKNRIEELKPVLRKQIVSEMINYGYITSNALKIKEFVNNNDLIPHAVLVLLLNLKEFVINAGKMEKLIFEIEKRIGMGLYNVISNDKAVFFVNKTTNIKEINETILKIKDEYSVEIFGGLGELKQGQPNTAYLEADEISKSAYFWVQNGVFEEKDYIYIPYSVAEIIDIQKQVYEKLLERQNESINDFLDEILNSLKERKYLYIQAVMLIKQMITILLSTLSEQMISMEDTNQIAFKYEQNINNIKTAKELKLVISGLVGELSIRIHSTGETQAEKMVKWAVDYLHNSYYEDISLQGLANKLFISNSYFSRIFKKYTGEGFASYLVKIRIGKAYELLNTGRYSVAEVTQKVGFKDPSYFSAVFKEYQRISPNQVINNIKKGQKS
ncbi:MAG: hypothetical protein JM58_13845 [Peptococcaceae bacterium BICA1-8]|nr:MAG: hypothetical protein JM58_13845 [Peptococcaceae bacterium BICA1-8]